MTEKQLAILLKINGDSREGKAALQAITDSLRTLPDDAKTSAGKLSASFSSALTDIRQGVNDAFNMGLGVMVANGVQAATASVKQFASESVGEFLDFEKVMTGVAKTTGLPKVEVDALAQSLRNIAADIGPILATDIGEIAEVAGQLGIASQSIEAGRFAEARSEIEAFSATIARAAIALPEFTGGAEQVAGVIAKQLNLFQDDTSAAENYLSAMNALANTTAANAAQIAGFLEGFTVAPQLNIAQHAAAALGATFVSMGQDAHDASTRLQSAIIKVTDNSTKSAESVRMMLDGNEEAVQRLAEMSGQSAADIEDLYAAFQAAVANDAVGAMSVLADALAEVENTVERSNLSSDAFGKVGSRVMNALIGNTELLAKNLDISKQAFEENTSIAEEFETAISTQGARFEELKSKITDVKIEVGEHLVAALAEVTETDLNPTIDQFREWLSTSQEAETFFRATLPTAIGGSVAALSGLLQSLTGLANGIASLSTTVGSFIGDLQSGITTAKEMFDVVIHGASGADKEIQQTADEIKALTAHTDDAMDAFSMLGGAATEALTDTADATDDAAKATEDYQQSVAKATNEALNFGDISVWHSVWPDVTEGTRYATEATVDYAGSVSAATGEVVGLGQQAGSTLAQLQTMMSGLQGSLGEMSGGLSGLGDLLGISELGEAAGWLDEIAQYTQIPDLLGEITGGLGGITSAIPGVDDLISGLTGNLGSLGGIAGTLTGSLGSLGGIASGALGSLTGALGSVGGAVTGALGSLGGLVGGLGAIAGPVGIAGAAIYGLTKVFGGLFDAESEGQKANKHWASYISEHIEGGDRLKDAVRGQYGDMKAAGYDYMTYLDAVGASTHNALGGFSDAWESGSGALDRFAQAAGTASGEMEKGPQLALETLGAMQEMGMGIDEVALAMGEMTAASLGTSTELEQQAVIEDMLANSSQLSADEIAALQGALADLQGQSSSTGQTVDGTTQALDGLGGTASGTSRALDGLGGAAADAAGDLSGTAMSADELRNAAEATSAATVGAGGSLFGLGNNAQQLKDDFGVLADEVDGSVSSLDELQRKIDEIPAQKHIQIQVDQDGAVPTYAAGGTIPTSGLAIVNERGPEIASFPGGLMALMTQPGPVLGAFPGGTEIIPHARSMQLLRDNPNLPRMATGGTVQAAPLGGVTVHIDTLVVQGQMGNATDMRRMATALSRQIATDLNARMRRR